jgi:hypothetical protein
MYVRMYVCIFLTLGGITRGNVQSIYGGFMLDSCDTPNHSQILGHEIYHLPINGIFSRNQSPVSKYLLAYAVYCVILCSL